MNRVKIVDSINDLRVRHFSPEVNVLRFKRKLTGDFNALAKALWMMSGRGDAPGFIMKGAGDTFQTLAKFKDDPAAEVIKNDIDRIIMRTGTLPHMRLLQHGGGADAEKTRWFHHDGSSGGPLAGRLMSFYAGACTLMLENEDALHTMGDRYAPRLDAKPFAFECGDLSLHPFHGPATKEKKILPLIHATPSEPGLRMMLVVDL